MQLNIDAAKTHLSRLADQAAAGEEILVARAGRPIARLVPLGTAHRPLLLDTHVSIWALRSPDHLDGETRAIISGPANGVLFGAASIRADRRPPACPHLRTGQARRTERRVGGSDWTAATQVAQTARPQPGADVIRPTATALLIAMSPVALAAPQPQPQPLAMPPTIAAPRDTPYRGMLRLAVDATDLARHIVAVHETLDVSGPGDLVLLYPQWIPGDHGPTGPIELLAGLDVRAGTIRLGWRRDPVDMYAFHVPVPDGVRSVEIAFQFLSPVKSEQGRVVMTPDMLDLQWNAVVLYPAGYFLRDIPTTASVRLPSDWKFATALEPSTTADATVHFKTEPLNVLLDSPLIAGRNFERVDLDPNGPAPVHLDIVADHPKQLAISPAQLAAHRAVVQQAYKLFGSHHYDHYDFLLAVSDELDGEGLEHHRSSEDATGGDYFTAWDKTFSGRDLLSHEFTHSWNGKYKRPADLWAPNLNIPERDSLLWVYEGQTQYWGKVLAARSGLWSREQALDALANLAAGQQEEVGRSWRPLEDTTDNPIFVRRRSLPWQNWQRNEDYYDDGALIWLDADTLIRQRTHGARSLDDFARAFYGTDDGSFVVSTYQFGDVVRALNVVTPYDWAGFLHARLDARASQAPLDGLTRGGYKLVFTDEPSPFATSEDRAFSDRDFTSSIGLTLKDKTVTDVAWSGPAWRAGLTAGSTLIAIDGQSFTDADDLADAIRDAGRSHAPLDLLVQTGKHVHTARLENVTGLRYPHLVPTGPDRSLDAILASRP